MLNLTRQNFNDIKNRLLRKQQQVEEELKDLDTEDPIMVDDLAESSESGTESWMADVHNQVVAVKQNLYQMLLKIKAALVSLKDGKYGKCENCGKQIEMERLEAVPMATLCVACSKKINK